MTAVADPTTAIPPAAERATRAGASAATDLAWRLAPVALAVLAGALYLVNITVSGYGNAYYAAAAQAGSQSWSAMFYGALDAGGVITVDKPPVAIWLAALSVRLFGLHPLAVLLPQALAGIAAVLLLHDAVRRQLGREAALIAGVAFAVTPAATLMFRYDNPDALLALLLVAAAWVLIRGLEDGRWRWPILAAVLVGVAFLTKYLQAYLVLPAFAATFLVAAPGGLRHRLGVLAASAVTVVVASAWWVVAVDLTPLASRPYIGGSTDGTARDLVLGYDGLGRLLGRGAGPAGTGGFGGGGGPGRGFGGDPGLLRLANAEWYAHIAWLLPSAASGLVAGLVARLRADRTDPRRAAFLLWGLWALVHVAVFSFMGGIAHPYYAVTLAPALAALTGGGLLEMWRARARVPWAGLVLAAVMVGTAAWGWQLLERTPSFFPGVGLGAVFVAVAAGILVVAAAGGDDPRSPAIGGVALALGVGAMLVGPVLFSVDTTGRAIAGGDPAPGPATGGFGAGPGGFGGVPGGPGGDTADTALVDWLVAHHGSETWLVAATSASQAAPLQLASGIPVIAMGGFQGSDPAPTVDQLRGWIREGRLRYVLLGGRGGGFGGFGGFGPGGGGSVASERTRWVTGACTPVPGVGSGLYDCAGAG